MIAYSFSTVCGSGQGNTDAAIIDIRKKIKEMEGFEKICILNIVEIAYSEPKKPKNEKVLV